MDVDDPHAASDSDGGPASSVTGSRKAEPLASADISLDNIVEGGRRKRAKFESSVSRLLLVLVLVLVLRRRSRGP